MENHKPVSVSRSVTIHLEAQNPSERHGEPVRCGVPWPAGVLHDVSQLRMENDQGHPVVLQTKILDRWPDGSIRWLLLDWQANVKETARYHVHIADLASGGRQPPVDAANHVLSVEENDRIVVNTGPATFNLRSLYYDLFESVIITENGKSYEIQESCGIKIYDPFDDLDWADVCQMRIEENGPLRVSVYVTGILAPHLWSEFEARLHFFAGSPIVCCDLTFRNHRNAKHPAGRWDLGDPGSIFIKDASLSISLPPGNETKIYCSPELGMPLSRCEGPLELYQDSSGGENWRSSNHLNRQHTVPNSFCGYRLRTGNTEQTGRRATPIVALERDGVSVAVTVPHFWQNFPKAVEVTPDKLTLRLFPEQYADLHELQGGEQKTHSFMIAFGRDAVTTEPLAWCRSPLQVRIDPAWYAASGAIPYLTPKADDPNDDYLRLVDAAIDGEDTFFHKREVIDEYGWRHFGDIYGDHEGVYHQGPTPLVSHYNNQYDPLAGFAYQWLRSGDARWRAMMDELAAHVVDIDIYHTDQDKSAYNHGLFWHTVHHVDADTATHRSYPRTGKTCGGGPSNEHNYTTGLLLHYFLTGNPQSRQAVIDLAQWVIDRDDGAQTVFRWLSRGDTGLASATASPLYHGPGRGAGNSINALLDGYRLTNDHKFLAKLEQLIRRCIHPADDLAERNLLDAERRWSYTVFLQALAKYLDFKIERGELDRMYAYARASLLHYARWMAEHEYPYLDKPELLQYPTETWAAQDMRKSEVFHYTAKHAEGRERERFLERAEFFFRTSTTTLAKMKTRTFARPVVILLSNGLMRAYFQKHPETSAPPPAEPLNDFGRPEVFVPQKEIAKRRFLMLAAAMAGGAILGGMWLLR